MSTTIQFYYESRYNPKDLLSDSNPMKIYYSVASDGSRDTETYFSSLENKINPFIKSISVTFLDGDDRIRNVIKRENRKKNSPITHIYTNPVLTLEIPNKGQLQGFGAAMKVLGITNYKIGTGRNHKQIRFLDRKDFTKVISAMPDCYPKQDMIEDLKVLEKDLQTLEANKQRLIDSDLGSEAIRAQINTLQNAQKGN